MAGQDTAPELCVSAQSLHSLADNQNDLFKEFRTAVWNVNHDDEPIPPMSRWLEREDDDPESDDEIEAGGTMQTYRCPISLTVFTDACKR